MPKKIFFSLSSPLSDHKYHFFSGLAIFMLLVNLLNPLTVLGASSHPSSLSVEGLSMIAGYGTILKINSAFPQEKVLVKVKKPDGSVLDFSTQVNEQGEAEVEISGNDVIKSGTYWTQASSPNRKILSKMTDFFVYPGPISPEKSHIEATKSVLKADGMAQTSVKVMLEDDYGNGIANHAIQLISSHQNDHIEVLTGGGLTNQSGIADFAISSNQSGISTLTAIDTTSNITLETKTRIAFLNPHDYLQTNTSLQDNVLQDAGGDPLASLIDVAQAAGNSTLSHFDIGQLPGTIQPNQNLSFSVTAQDETNQTVQNYTGQVHFSVEGDNSNNVKLPEDYTFKAEDLGTHTFDLSLSFPANGSYKLIVTDLGNQLLKGEKTVTVGSGNNVNNQNGAVEKPTIETPTAGTYSQKNQTISGKAPAGYTVKIYDNQQEIGSVQSDSNGHYTFQTTALADGDHSIYAIALDASQSVKGTSDTVKFSIDTTPPKVDNIKLTPDGNVQAGQSVQVDVASEENLSQSAMVFNTDIVPLNPSLDQPGHYTGSLQAPKTAGVYPVDIILVDQLGNEGSYKAKAQITVTADATSQEPSSPPGAGNPTPPPTPTPASTGPSKVTGLISYGSDQKVTLVWDAATPTSNTTIKHYRVYYGNDPSQLKNSADTKDASTTWYVPKLENGKQYYFAVTAFDDQGNESSAKSEIITGTPYTSEVVSLAQNNSPQSLNYNYDAIDQLHGSADTFHIGTPPTSPGSGPEVALLFPIAGLLAFARKKFKKNKVDSVLK